MVAVNPKKGRSRRRFSLDAAMSSLTGKLGKKKKRDEKGEKLRTVKGPFSVATTSSKTPKGGSVFTFGVGAGVLMDLE